MSKPVTQKDLCRIRDWDSRKYRTAWYLTWLFIALFVIPALISLVVSLITGNVFTFAILSEGVFASFLGGIWGVYFGFNVAEKMDKFKPKEAPTIDYASNIAEDTGNDRAGQPENTDNP